MRLELVFGGHFGKVLGGCCGKKAIQKRAEKMMILKGGTTRGRTQVGCAILGGSAECGGPLGGLGGVRNPPAHLLADAAAGVLDPEYNSL